MRHRQKKSAHPAATDAGRTPPREKWGRKEYAKHAIGVKYLPAHLAWCVNRRRQMVIRRSRSILSAGTAKFGAEDVGVRDIMDALALGRIHAGQLALRFVKEKSPVSLPVLEGLLVPHAERLESQLLARFRQVVEGHFARPLRLYRGIKRLALLKCPFCGNHSAIRLCSLQTLRLLRISLEHGVQVLSSCDATDNWVIASCVAGFYGWNKFGADTDEIRRDLLLLLRSVGLELSIGVPLWLQAVLSTSDDLWYLLSGKRMMPQSDFVELWKKEQSRLMGVTAHEIVWNIWFAVGRACFGIRTTPLRYLHREVCEDVVKAAASFQRAYYSKTGLLWMVSAIEVVESSFLKNLGEWVPILLYKDIGVFQNLVNAHESTLRAATRSVTVGGAPPPPPPPGRLRGVISSESYALMSPRQVVASTYSSDQEWPRCHVGWVCTNRNTHCVYPVPGFRVTNRGNIPLALTGRWGLPPSVSSSGRVLNDWRCRTDRIGVIPIDE